VTSFPLPSIQHRTFNAKLAVEDSSMRVTLAGTADLLVQQQLSAFLMAVHVCATDHLATTVLVDINGLGFINSSCLKCMVTWIFKVRTEEKQRQYQIIFLANPKAQWQQRSFHALSCMCAELVSIQQD
jgi:hypothetical protein